MALFKVTRSPEAQAKRSQEIRRLARKKRASVTELNKQLAAARDLKLDLDKAHTGGRDLAQIDVTALLRALDVVLDTATEALDEVVRLREEAES